MKKHPGIFWSGLGLTALGVYVVISRLAPRACGVAGALVSRFIAPYTGNATIVLGVMIIAAGALLAFLKRPGARVGGIALLAVPVLIVAHAAEGLAAGSSATLGGMLSGVIQRYLGAFGMWTAAIILFFVAIWLVAPILTLRAARALANLVQRKPVQKPAPETSAGTRISAATASPSSALEAGTDAKSPAPAATTAPGGDQASGRQGTQDLAAANAHVPPKDSPAVAQSWLDLERRAGYFEEVAAGMFPSVTTLDGPEADPGRPRAIIDAFAAFDVTLGVGDVAVGPSFEQYEIEPGPGVKIAKIKNVIDDVGVRLKCKASLSQRATDGALVLELPATKRIAVPYGFVLENPEDDHYQLPIALGVDASFHPHSLDLAAAPHLLAAGTTGSGKSVFLRSMIASLLYHTTPNQVRLVLIDPKRVEFGIFAGISYLARPVITDIADASRAFEELVAEMERRYEALERSGCSDRSGYVAGGGYMPAIVTVVDEFADLFLSADKKLKTNCIRLAQKARACGIHLVLGTQRPSADVIDGLLKTNIPGRIALTVSSGTDSRIIIDRSGAENLTGKGDMICITPDFREGIRMQAAILEDREVKELIGRKAVAARFGSLTEALAYAYDRTARPREVIGSRLVMLPQRDTMHWEPKDTGASAVARVNAGECGPVAAWLEALSADAEAANVTASIAVIAGAGEPAARGSVRGSRLRDCIEAPASVADESLRAALERCPDAAIHIESLREADETGADADKAAPGGYTTAAAL